MCRIYGNFNALVARTDLDTVSALQAHGGPDQNGRAIGARWSLGSNRLAVMEPAGGRQPYEGSWGTPRDRGIRVVFNGEIYNHHELRADLRARGFRFVDHCDGSILPALYQVHGEYFAEHIDGMYAIAVLDTRERPRLLLARDRLGMKPLYYSWQSATRSLFFASEIPSLLGFPAVGDGLRTTGLDDYLATKTPFGDQTMFSEISSLPTGATVVCEAGTGLRTAARLPSPRRDPQAPEASAPEVREQLTREVDRLMVVMIIYILGLTLVDVALL